MAFDVTGTVRHERPSPAYGFRQSVADGLHSASKILRNQRMRDMLAAVEEWQRASGPDRTYWRGQASWLIGQWRCLHQEPEMRAFREAVARRREAA